MKIESLNLALSDNLKQILQLQEELQKKMYDSVSGVPFQYFGERKLTTEENKALEVSFKKCLSKYTTLKNRN